MQVSGVSADYSQNTKASNHVEDNRQSSVNKSVSDIGLHKSTEKESITSAIQEWKNFCHQQILKGKLDIIA